MKDIKEQMRELLKNAYIPEDGGVYLSPTKMERIKDTMKDVERDLANVRDTLFHLSILLTQEEK